MSVLATQELLLENILECIPVGEFAVIQPLSDEFCLVLGYLLTWKLTLTFFKAASSQVYAQSPSFQFFFFFLVCLLDLAIEILFGLFLLIVCSPTSFGLGGILFQKHQ